MIATKSGVRAKRPRTKVPEYLIYEIMDGKPIHYKGYREVLAGTKKVSEIIGSSTLQALIVTHLIILLGKQIDENQYTILSSEAGMHLDKRTNLAGDILIFDNATLPIDAINEFYAQVPPKIVIEVDISADSADVDTDGYIFQKTQKLLNFGVEKVIWITTVAKKVTVATPQGDWQVKDWHKDIDVLEGIQFNIGQYLAKKGSSFA
ncbi:Uma2 family endonuclease [Spirosoma terrae]|uniref:Uma2 family endonuclease n=1 Tax=Spirosoma terrae TaxID=1968276 RepID=UPI001478718A|nr:Uma2 family endonuclease [Spirosoma terrae]